MIDLCLNDKKSSLYQTDEASNVFHVWKGLEKQAAVITQFVVVLTECSETSQHVREGVETL